MTTVTQQPPPQQDSLYVSPTNLLSPCDSCVTISETNYYNQSQPSSNNLQSILYSNFDEKQFHQQLIETFLHSRSKLSSNSVIVNNHIEPTTTTEQEITLIHNENNQIVIKLSSIINLINTFLYNHGEQYQIDTKDLTINHLIIYLYYNQLTLFSFDNIAYINQFNLFHLGKCLKFNHSNINLVYLNKLKLNQFNTFLLSVLNQNQSSSATNVYRYFNIDNYLCESLHISNKNKHKFSKSVVNMLVKKIKHSSIESSSTTTTISKDYITTTSSVQSVDSSLSSSASISTTAKSSKPSKSKKFKFSLKRIFT
ncbi:hypothetical protein DFJ63DRAFT_206973 [Scheffersomyces coipomensis]|uniref:uncharacterized protein n=1 Tax=Scheffersomyces coipomensis TaxID=1788519 RepID=UPI00315D9E76